MKANSMMRSARALAAAALLAISAAWGGAALAQQPSPTPSATPAPAASPTPQASGAPAPAASPTPGASATPAPNPELSSPDKSSTGEIVELASQPSAYIEGKANRDEVYSAIMGSIATVRAELDKAGLKPAGDPIAVFLEADDIGFKYRVEIPISAVPEGKTQLSDAVKFGQTPVGKAMRFEHRGAYDDIDATYEAITAYLDEKSIDAQDVFIEKYLNEVKTSDDPNLQVDIFVLLK